VKKQAMPLKPGIRELIHPIGDEHRLENKAGGKGIT